MKPIAALALLTLALAAPTTSIRSEQAEAAAPADEEIAAPDFTLLSVKNKKVRLSSFRGKVVLLDFWATWCPPCRMSLPALVSLHEKLKDRPAQIIGISVDEDASGVPGFVKRRGIEYPVVCDPKNEVSAEYQVRAIPTFVLVDAKGKVRRMYPGYYSGLEKQWEKDISSLIETNTLAPIEGPR